MTQTRHFSVSSPTPTTLLFTVSSRPPPSSSTAASSTSFSSRTRHLLLRYLLVLLRILAAAAVLGLESARFRVILGLGEDEGFYDAGVGGQVGTVVESVDWRLCLVVGIMVLWGLSRRGYRGTCPTAPIVGFKFQFHLLRFLFYLGIVLGQLEATLSLVVPVPCPSSTFMTELACKIRSNQHTPIYPSCLSFGYASKPFRLIHYSSPPLLFNLSTCSPKASPSNHRHSLQIEESLLVLRDIGLQTTSTSPSYLTSSTTHFIPATQIQDIVIHEAFVGLEVKFYLAVIVQGRGDVVVVFPVSLSSYSISFWEWDGRDNYEEGRRRDAARGHTGVVFVVVLTLDNTNKMMLTCCPSAPLQTESITQPRNPRTSLEGS